MAKRKIPLTQEYIKSILDYNPETGIFTWKWRLPIHHRILTWNTKYANKIAGSIRRGYFVICIYRVAYPAHHLAWCYMTGEWPIQIDHRDLNRSNNIFTNIRKATSAQNCANKKLSKVNNTSGYKGIYWLKKKKRWRATIVVNGDRMILGTAKTPEGAYAIYCKAAIEYHGEFARLE